MASTESRDKTVSGITTVTAPHNFIVTSLLYDLNLASVLNGSWILNTNGSYLYSFFCSLNLAFQIFITWCDVAFSFVDIYNSQRSTLFSATKLFNTCLHDFGSMDSESLKLRLAGPLWEEHGVGNAAGASR